MNQYFVFPRNHREWGMQIKAVSIREAKRSYFREKFKIDPKGNRILKDVLAKKIEKHNGMDSCFHK